ncbi:hypothetical protein DSM107010_62890 [Chroococcidiopsis cubana SAG 39.79]|uniref:Uncharacterized protein n=1 Tax=Chroococcidiopsis cubana SAG 39.79 TaxID=388085 RepID=A0AB37UA27_9CYAN|nr:hypothetical protein [Chroococcidiopsis cubana]RUT02349.1 hypothetical protein DSM107010_62890 [Chroococcidiopsis cubana SAG 39.79]
MSPISTVNDTIAAGAVKEYDNPNQISACTITSNRILRATVDGTTTPTDTVGEAIPINTPIALKGIPNVVKGLKIKNTNATNAATITIQYFTRGDL